MTLSGKSVKFAPAEATQLLGADGAFERLTPSGGLGLVKSVGSFSIRDEARPRELRLDLSIDKCTLGPLPLPTMGRSADEMVLLLDPTLCITQPVGAGPSELSVWVRPSMSAKGLDDDDDYY